MTDYRIPPPTMNLWTDDNASLMEAFMSSSDLTSFWAPPSSAASTSADYHPRPPPTSASSHTQAPVPAASPAPLNQESLMQRLQALIEGARESWTYAIFWQSSYDVSAGAAVLGWGEGFYKGEKDKVVKSNANTSLAEQEYRKKVLRDLNSLISGADTSADDAVVDQEVTDTEWFFLVSMTQSFVNGGGLPSQAFYHSNPVWVAGAGSLAGSSCERARQGQVFGLQTMVCIPTANGVVELGSTELIFQSANLMNKVKVLFDFNNSLEVGSAWPIAADLGEKDPSSLWFNDNPSGTAEVVKETISIAPASSAPINPITFVDNNPSSSSLSQVNHHHLTTTQSFFTRELNFSEYTATTA